jgi:hypothetical protein
MLVMLFLACLDFLLVALRQSLCPALSPIHRPQASSPLPLPIYLPISEVNIIQEFFFQPERRGIAVQYELNICYFAVQYELNIRVMIQEQAAVQFVDQIGDEAKAQLEFEWNKKADNNNNDAGEIWSCFLGSPLGLDE